MIDPDQQSYEAAKHVWSLLQVGAPLMIVKLAPDGVEAARYPGDVAVGLDDDNWIVVHAVWAHGTINLDGLEFCLGDRLLEWFSPRYPMNAFAVLTAEGHFKGWYANISHPARLDVSTDPPTLVWHDLYVDLVGLPDQTFTIRDDDELRASKLNEIDPQLHDQIIWARSELIRRFQYSLPPFTEVSQSVRMLILGGASCRSVEGDASKPV